MININWLSSHGKSGPPKSFGLKVKKVSIRRRIGVTMTMSLLVFVSIHHVRFFSYQSSIFSRSFSRDDSLSAGLSCLFFLSSSRSVISSLLR